MTNYKHQILVQLADNHSGIRHYKTRRKSLAARMTAAVVRFTYELTIGSVVHLINGVHVVRR